MLSCNVVDNTQMLIIGGTFTLPGDSDLCDAPGMSQDSFAEGVNAKERQTYGEHTIWISATSRPLSGSSLILVWPDTLFLPKS